MIKLWKEIVMDRKEMARRRLAEVTDLEDRLRLVMVAELGPELVGMLPNLIERGACSFEVYNTPCPTFAVDGIQPDNSCLYVWLEIHLGNQHVSVNFAGLMKQLNVDGLAGSMVELIIRKKFGGGDYSTALNVQMNAADVFALRSHYPSSILRDRIELSAIYHALKGPVAVGVALGLLPEEHSTHRIPAEQQLVPIVEHFRSVGVEQIIIDQMIEMLFQDTDTLVSLDKVVALAAIHRSSATRHTETVLRSQLRHILALHFMGNSPFEPSSNLSWLIEHGLVHRDILNTHGHERSQFDDALVAELSRGRLTAVHQFLFTFITSRERKRIDRRAAQDSIAIIQALLPRAFKAAMEAKDYGHAAAIGQIANDISADDRLRALELAVIHDQPIRVEWAYILR